MGRFLSADTVVPSPGNPQSHNRYAYALDNALKYTDPTGHAEVCADEACSGALFPLTQYWIAQMLEGPSPYSTVPNTQIDYSDPTIWDQPYWLDEGIPFPDAIGIRLDGSGPWPKGLAQVPIGSTTGPDINLEAIVWFPTYEQDAAWGIFVTPGIQASYSPSPKGGAGLTAGLLTVWGVKSPDDYIGPGVSPGLDYGPVEVDVNMSGAGRTVYTGFQLTGPSDPTMYATAGKTLMIAGGFFPSTRYIKSNCAGMAVPPRGGC